MKALTSHITNARLREALNYDPASGVFTWASKVASKCVVGAPAGCQTPAGYIRITIDGVPHMAHRLAWQWATGEAPAQLIDHENRVRNDNRITNLRLADCLQNIQNSVWARPNKHGFTGVYWSAPLGKWIATIRTGDGKRKHLGVFVDPAAAGAAYAAARVEFHNFATEATIAASVGATRGRH